MERQFNWGEQKSLQLSHFDCAETKIGQVQLKWSESTRVERQELRWEERDERTVQEWCQNLRQELRSFGKMMEVCCSSYRQNLFLDPIAVHFWNLETSATRLAWDLLVLIFPNWLEMMMTHSRETYQPSWETHDGQSDPHLCILSYTELSNLSDRNINRCYMGGFHQWGYP